MRQIPDLNDCVAVPAATVREFRECGHAIVRRLATPEEVAAFRPAIVATGPKGQYDHRPLAERDTYGKAFVQMFNLWTHDARVRAFVFAQRFAQVAADLMGVAGVRLYHDQALFKEAGGGFTPWHQDHFYWPLDTPHTITMWMPLVEVTAAMGPMRFASGSHTLGNLGEFAIGDASETAFSRLVAEHGLPVVSYKAFQPGDATFHDGWTLHSAAANETDRTREVMTVIYFADGTRVGPLDHPSRQLDAAIWLDGAQPGDPAAGPLNPVLYARGPTPKAT